MTYPRDNQRRSARGLLLAMSVALSLICAQPLAARATGEPQSLPSAAGYGVGSVLGTVVYAPVKIAYAALGSLTGGLAWLASGGNDEVVESVIGPAIRGTYVITPEALRAPDFPASVAFVGREESQRAIAAHRQSQLAAVAAPPPQDCQDGDAIAIVYFATGRSDLAPRGNAALKDAVSLLERCRQKGVDVRGFADSTGSADANVELSRQRAKTVSAYLVRQGVSTDRIQWQGYGAAYAADDPDRASDRRVAIFLRDS